MFADIVGMGVSVWDTLMGVDHYPDEEEVLRASKRHPGLGGGVAVATATASVLGATAAMIDRLGKDIASEAIVKQLDVAAVDTRLVVRDPTASASVASVWVNQSSGARTIVFSPGENIDLIWDRRLAAPIENAKVLHLNGRHLEASLKAVEVAKRGGTKVSYDGGAHRYRDGVLPVVRQADLLVVAEHFAQSHVGGATLTPADLCDRLLGDFPAELVGVTCGEQGSWFATRQGARWYQAAFPCESVVDTTGCGDVFHGAFLAAYAKGHSWERCAEFASRVAAFHTGELGAFSAALSQFAESI